MAIGKGKGVSQITTLLQEHKKSSKMVLVCLKLLNVLCLQGITRKQLSTNEAVLHNFLTLIPFHMNRRCIIFLILEIIYKLSTGATLTKTLLRNSILLPTLSKVINHYQEKIPIKNLASSSISEVFKTSNTDEEDSNETWSSSESSSSDEETCLPESPPTSKKEQYLAIKMDNDRQKSILKQLQEDLVKEKLERMQLDEELTKAKYHRTAGNSRKQEKDLENHQLRLDYQREEQLNTELQLQIQFDLKEIETVTNIIQLRCHEIKAEEQKQSEEFINPLILEIDQKNTLIDQLSTPLSDAKRINDTLQTTLDSQEDSLKGHLVKLKEEEMEKEKVLEEIKTLSDNNYKMENLLSQSADDRLLFEWMTMAIRLDYLMHTKTKKTLYFDQEATYEYLKENKVPVAGWPKKILMELSTNKK